MSTKTEKKIRSVLRSDRDPFLPLIPEFLEYLRHAGLSEKSICGFPGPAKHFIIWLEQNSIELNKIDDVVSQRFFRHDCNCPRPKGERYQNHVKRSRTFKAIILRFIQFLEETGRAQNPVAPDEGLCLQEDFLKHLIAEGYASGTIIYYKRACRHFRAWLHRSRIPIAKIDEAVVERFFHHDCICPGFFLNNAKQNRNHTMKIERFVRFLIVRGVVPGISPIPKEELSKDLVAFRVWLRQHRGIGESTIQRHTKNIATLLPDLGHDPDKYDASAIKHVLLNHFKKSSRLSAQQMTTSLRMYLRFLASNDRCSLSLTGAIPSIPRWRLSALPRYILADDVERVIASCDITTPKGMRDRAILLLLARLALRGGDIVNMRLADIDWENAVLRVSGKSRQMVGLPLPQDVGDAILSYIEHGRPRIDEKKVFLRAIAPYRPFSSSSPITIIVREALKRAGVDNANLRGAYLLRHSAATNMLRSGATLEAVGTLLRHRSPETTTIYAKVDIPMLEQVVQPWIGGVKC